MNGVFAVYKPSGITSAKFIERIQNKFTKSEVFAKDLQEMKDKIRSDLSRDRKWKPQRLRKDRLNQGENWPWRYIGSFSKWDFGGWCWIGNEKITILSC